jgi:hypothetical protein
MTKSTVLKPRTKVKRENYSAHENHHGSSPRAGFSDIFLAQCERSLLMCDPRIHEVEHFSQTSILSEGTVIQS